MKLKKKDKPVFRVVARKFNDVQQYRFEIVNNPTGLCVSPFPGDTIVTSDNGRHWFYSANIELYRMAIFIGGQQERYLERKNALFFR